MDTSALDAALDAAAPWIEGDRWHCDTKDKAAWAAEKLRRARAQQAENAALVADRLARLTAWRDGENARLEREAEHMEAYLREYLDGVRAEDPKVKSVRLPDARPRYRQAPAKYERDEAALLAWANENAPGYIQLDPRVHWDALQAVLTGLPDGTVLYVPTGEVVPGVTYHPAQDRFSVELFADPTEKE